MSVLEFIASLVASLVWPVFAVVAILLLREPLGGLIGLLRSLKYGDLELSFGADLAEAETLASATDTPTTAAAQLADGGGVVAGSERASHGPDQKLIALADADPRTAIMRAWADVEATLVALARERLERSEPTTLRMPLVLASLLEAQRMLPMDEVVLIRKLKKLRDEAAHAAGMQLSSEQAIRYVTLASAVAQRLQRR